MDLVLNSLVGQNTSTASLMYKCMERVLKGDAIAIFLQKAYLVGSRTVANFTTFMQKYLYTSSLVTLILINDDTCKGT